MQTVEHPLLPVERELGRHGSQAGKVVAVAGTCDTTHAGAEPTLEDQEAINVFISEGNPNAWD